MSDPIVPAANVPAAKVPAAPSAAEFATLMASFAAMQAQLNEMKAASKPEDPLEKYKDLGEVVYTHYAPGSSIVVMRGQHAETHYFLGGHLRTSDPVLHAFLQPLAAQMGSPVGIGDRVPVNTDGAAAAAAVVKAAGRTIDKLGAEAGVVQS